MISIEQLEQTLSEQYVLKCFVDLADLSVSPTAAYKHFQSCYQEVFDNNDRLVFYTTDVISDKFLQHLYQSANLIDISNCFVLICSPHDISATVTDIAHQYFADLSAFCTLQLSFDLTDKLQDSFVVSDTICPLPWRHLEVSPQGEIRPCCVYSSIVGNVNNVSLKETFYGNEISTLRQDLLSGKKPSGCKQCWIAEDNGLISYRRRYMGLLSKELLTVDLDHYNIKSLDIKPGNTCNFKCRICSPLYSSLFAEESKKSGTIFAKTINWAESDSKTINEIIELLPTLTNIDMYGGEPFLIKPLIRLVEHAVDQGYAKNMRLHYNSNGSVYPEKFIEYWKKFEHVDIHFSIDNIGNKFEIERGGSWNQVESNIKQLINLKLPNVEISIMPTISIMNIFYLDEVLQWASNLNLSVNPSYVTNPIGFNLKNLTVDAKDLIIKKFQHHQWPEMQNILAYIKSNPDSDGQEFTKLCNHFDHLRNQNFANSHPEVAKAMGYVYNKTL
jgi:radical SAM protein with 4Fe4S-binding SPASM domain